MTYIEFFDRVASENISACLTYAPERVILLGDSSKLMKKHIAYYERVFKDRGCDIEFDCRAVSKSNLSAAVDVINEIVEKYDDCVFDITGGDELLNLALGIVYSENKEKNIQIHKFNLKSNVIYDCDKDGNTIYKNPPKLSVEENIRIFGGDVVYGSIDEAKTYIWDFTPDFMNDVGIIWNLCKGNVRLWNSQIGVLAAAQKVGEESSDGLTVTAEISDLKSYLARFKASHKLVGGMMDYLCEHKLITNFTEDENILQITYKNPQVKKCLTKAGLALELKIYSVVKNLTEQDGTPVYNDAVNGVVIDWDGKFHDEDTEKLYDTENEVDILLMHDVVPIFISCKNGVIMPEELYKLNTVADHFGGKYAKKVLVSTSLSTLGESGEYIRQRAADMGIKCIEDVQDMSETELSKKFSSLWL